MYEDFFFFPLPVLPLHPSSLSLLSISFSCSRLLLCLAGVDHSAPGWAFAIGYRPSRREEGAAYPPGGGGFGEERGERYRCFARGRSKALGSRCAGEDVRTRSQWFDDDDRLVHHRTVWWLHFGSSTPVHSSPFRWDEEVCAFIGALPVFFFKFHSSGHRLLAWLHTRLYGVLVFKVFSYFKILSIGFYFRLLYFTVDDTVLITGFYWHSPVLACYWFLHISFFLNYGTFGGYQGSRYTSHRG